MMNEIQIVIKGEAGSGKTTVGILIEQALRDKQLDATFAQEEISHGDKFDYAFWNKVETIGLTTKIVIKEQQVRKLARSK